MTGVTPFQPVYGHEAIVPAEIMFPSLKIEGEKELIAKEYEILMNEKLNEINEIWLFSFDHLQAYHSLVSNAYNKRVNTKSFSIGDLVLKLILSIV